MKSAKSLVLLALLACLNSTVWASIANSPSGKSSFNFEIPPVNQKAAAQNLADASRFGLPSQDNLRLFNDYFLSYDRRLKGPVWVFQHHTSDKLRDIIGAGGNRGNCFFKEDTQVHPYFRPSHLDYSNSGYTKGHMAPAQDYRYSQIAIEQTFSLSNAWPQKKEMNEGCWARLEKYALFLSKRSKNTYIVTGALFLPQRDARGNLYVKYELVGQRQVSVPSHFYKVILVEDNRGDLSMEAFLMPNTAEANGDTMIQKYRLPVDQLDKIERAAGVIFFHKVNRNKIKKPGQLQFGFQDKKIVFNN